MLPLDRRFRTFRPLNAGPAPAPDYSLVSFHLDYDDDDEDEEEEEDDLDDFDGLDRDAEDEEDEDDDWDEGPEEEWQVGGSDTCP